MRIIDHWVAVLEIEADAVSIELSGLEGVLLRGSLTRDPTNPRALLWILEGLALWVGRLPLCVVICADGPVHPSLGLGVDGDDWPPNSPHLDFMFCERRRRRRLGHRA